MKSNKLAAIAALTISAFIAVTETSPDALIASATVTAIRVPEGVDGQDLVARVRTGFGVILGGGQQELTGKIFRVGHMGWVDPADIDEAFDAVEETLKSMRA